MSMKERSPIIVPYAKRVLVRKVTLEPIYVSRVHEEKKPYDCTICEKRFDQKINLKTHISRVHEYKKEKK